ncbi:UNVERIFIED_CONTAM: hypothetical protein FKN15_033535 [Acipenser sinensis]
MLEKPDDREVVCHASAWDFYNRKDFSPIEIVDLLGYYHKISRFLLAARCVACIRQQCGVVARALDS